MSSIDDISAVLGKKVSYSSKYDPGILVREKRSRNRDQYAIDEKNLKFVGYDNWNAYEISFLLTNGYPISGVAKIVYACDNPYLVESKSLKLYLNSFNMEKMGDNPLTAISNFTAQVETDLSELLKADVQVHVFLRPEKSSNLWRQYTDINDTFDISKLKITEYNETPTLLRAEIDGSKRFQIAIRYLRSNCKITSQPDWGTAFIHYKGDISVKLESLAQYIISFRNENHFHEEVCEMIFTRLYDTFAPKELMVACQYTRRGGIDINPIRATSEKLIPLDFQRAEAYFHRELQQ